MKTTINLLWFVIGFFLGCGVNANFLVAADAEVMNAPTIETLMFMLGGGFVLGFAFYGFSKWCGVVYNRLKASLHKFFRWVRSLDTKKIESAELAAVQN